MNLDKLNNWLSLLANLGVVAGIIFLAIEIRQNSDVQLATSRQQMLEADLGIIDNLFSHPEMIRNRDRIDETDEEIRLRLYWIQMLRSREFAYLQFQNGLMDNETWESYFGPVMRIFRNETGREYIESGSYQGNKEYIEYLVNRIN